jgi:hypothetical protein
MTMIMIAANALHPPLFGGGGAIYGKVGGVLPTIWPGLYGLNVLALFRCVVTCGMVSV